MKDYLLFVDAETDGLYGRFLTVAMLVTDLSGEQVIAEGYWGIADAANFVTDSWTSEHVVPVLGDYDECENEEQLLEKAWSFWEKYGADAYAVADVPYPVEARLFEECVARDEKNRTFQAPFPMFDLSTILFWEGEDPLGDRTLYVKKDTKVHNAMADVRMSAELWSVFRKRRRTNE